MTLKHIPMAGFLAFTLRIVIFGASLGDSFAMLALVSLYLGMEYLDRKFKDVVNVNEETKKELEKMKTMIDSLKLAFAQRR